MSGITFTGSAAQKAFVSANIAERGLLFAFITLITASKERDRASG